MFVSGRPFQPSLIFVGKAKSGAFERCLTQVDSGLTRKHWLEKLAREGEVRSQPRVENQNHLG